MTARMHPAYFLAGPTAIGKTALAHLLAVQNQWPILSADAMLVYRGMDIGTAKPTAAERAGIPAYGGLDLVTPDQRFSVGAYLAAAHRFLSTLPADQPVLVVGGTGLYIKALLLGLDPMPAVDDETRAWAEALYARAGLVGIQQACRDLAPDRFAALDDPQNPRRVLRALELARMGVPYEGVWAQAHPAGTVVLMERNRTQLTERIEQRVDQMWAGGLIEEVRDLQKAYPEWSDTAAKAIGYQEARAVLAGECAEGEARAQIIRRTRKLARKQSTWFRHQAAAHSVSCDGRELADVAAEVLSYWRTHGPGIISG
jgi:tRNA dimethylallyltransferase